MWRKNACEFVGNVADENFQRQAWLGKGRCVSSPLEVFNQVFGDLAFEEFIVSLEIDLNDLQKAEDLRLEQVIDHPAWKEVRLTAQRLLDLLQCLEQMPKLAATPGTTG